MNQINRLQRANKHFEINDLSFRVPLDHVDTVDADAINFNLKLQHGIIWPDDFPNVAKRFVEKDFECRAKVLRSDSFAKLRCINNWRVEYNVVVK